MATQTKPGYKEFLQPDNTYRYWTYDAQVYDCQAADALFAQLTDKLAATSVVKPSGVYTARSCNGSSNASGLPQHSSIGFISSQSYSNANSGTLQIHGAGASENTGYELMIERQDGTLMTLGNADHQSFTLLSGVFYAFGPSGDPTLPMDWTFWGVAMVPLRISIRKNGQVQVITFIPSLTSSAQSFTYVTTTGSGTGTTSSSGGNVNTSTGSTTAQSQTNSSENPGDVFLSTSGNDGNLTS